MFKIQIENLKSTSCNKTIRDDYRAIFSFPIFLHIAKDFDMWNLIVSAKTTLLSRPMILLLQTNLCRNMTKSSNWNRQRITKFHPFEKEENQLFWREKFVLQLCNSTNCSWPCYFFSGSSQFVSRRVLVIFLHVSLEEWSRHRLSAMMIRPHMLRMVEVQKQLMRERKVSGGGSELFVIDGDRGSGKSCLLNYLTIFARQENWYHFWNRYFMKRKIEKVVGCQNGKVHRKLNSSSQQTHTHHCNHQKRSKGSWTWQRRIAHINFHPSHR